MLFGPLDISYCLLFYILSVGNLFICFCLFILLILNVKIFRRKTEICVLLILFFMLFIENRLLYSMCLNDTIPEIIESNDITVVTKLQNTLDETARQQTATTTGVASLNTGLGNVSNIQQNNERTISEMLKYVNTQSDIWNSQSQTMLNSMDNMKNSLSKIDKHLDPAQYTR